MVGKYLFIVGASLLMSLSFLAPAQAHSTGRWCSNSHCTMCQRLHLIAGHDQVERELYKLGSSKWDSFHSDLHEPPKVDSTPLPVVTMMLRVALPNKDEVLCDLGCGDGRIVISAAKNYGCRAVGIEIDKRTADLARRNVRIAGVGHLVTIIHGDAREYSMDGIDIVTMYLFPDLMVELQPKIFKAKRIVSYSHEIPRVRNLKVGEKYPIYIWRK